MQPFRKNFLSLCAISEMTEVQNTQNFYGIDAQPEKHEVQRTEIFNTEIYFEGIRLSDEFLITENISTLQQHQFVGY